MPGPRAPRALLPRRRCQQIRTGDLTIESPWSYPLSHNSSSASVGHNGRYGVLLADYVIYVGVTRCTWQPSSKRHKDSVVAPYAIMDNTFALISIITGNSIITGRR